MMPRVFLYILLLLLPIGYASKKSEIQPSPSLLTDCERLYEEMHLENVINYTAFEQLIWGCNNIDICNKDIVTLIDFSKPSTDERLYVMDLRQKKLLYVSHVAHGRNSGDNYATSFSNIPGSYQSSLGFYKTENTYEGRNGYSLILDGLEKGINDKAKERAIVVHGADYANPACIESMGRLGRSFGCPALPRPLNKTIINTIKDGTLLYIFANDRKYLGQSDILSPQKNNTAGL